MRNMVLQKQVSLYDILVFLGFIKAASKNHENIYFLWYGLSLNNN